MNNNFEKLYNYILNNNNKLNINLITNNIFYIKTNEILKCKSKFLNLEYNNNFDKLLKEEKEILNNYYFSNKQSIPTIHFILFKIIETINNISKLICLHESDYFIIFNNKECLCKCKNKTKIISNVSICIDINEILIELNKEINLNLILKSINSNFDNYYNQNKNLNEPLWNLVNNI